MSSFKDTMKKKSSISLLPDRQKPFSKEQTTNSPINYNSTKFKTNTPGNFYNYSSPYSIVDSNNQIRSCANQITTSSTRSPSNSRLFASQLNTLNSSDERKSISNGYLNNNTFSKSSLYLQSHENNGNYVTKTNLQTRDDDKYFYKKPNLNPNGNFETRSLDNLYTPNSQPSSRKYYTDEHSFNSHSNKDNKKCYQHTERKYSSETNLHLYNHCQNKREDSEINSQLALTRSDANFNKMFPETFSEWKSIKGDCKYCDNSKLIQYLYSKIEKLEIQKQHNQAENLKTLQFSEKKDNLTSNVIKDLRKSTEHLDNAAINESNSTTSSCSKIGQSTISRSVSGRISPSLSRPRLQSPQLTDRNETPIGFENPLGYCFLNCVVQLLYSCKEFRDKLIHYHHSDDIVNTESDMSENIFVNDFSRLMMEIKNCNSDKVREFVKKIQSFFSRSSMGDDVLTCFMNILSVVHKVTSSSQRLIRSASLHNLSANDSFESFRRKNCGFVFDLFYGQMSYTIKCITCGLIVIKKYQLFKSIPLHILKTRKVIPLKNIIKLFLEKTHVESNEIKNCKCDYGVSQIYSFTEINHAPRYLFIYLNRGSYYEEEDKNDTFISCDKILELPTDHGNLSYQLISVINHIGVKDGGHYYAKSCFETDIWWNLNDSSVSRIYDQQDIVTKDTIVFLFKKLMD